MMWLGIELGSPKPLANQFEVNHNTVEILNWAVILWKQPKTFAVQKMKVQLITVQ